MQGKERYKWLGTEVSSISIKFQNIYQILIAYISFVHKQRSYKIGCSKSMQDDPDHWESFDSLLSRSIFTTAGLHIGLLQFVGLFLSLVYAGEPEEFINDFLKERKDGRFNFSMLSSDFLRGKYLILLKCLDAYYLTK